MVFLLIDCFKKKVCDGFKRSESRLRFLFHLSISATSPAPPGGLTDSASDIVEYLGSFGGLDKTLDGSYGRTLGPFDAFKSPSSVWI